MYWILRQTMWELIVVEGRSQCIPGRSSYLYNTENRKMIVRCLPTIHQETGINILKEDKQEDNCFKHLLYFPGEQKMTKKR